MILLILNIDKVFIDMFKGGAVLSKVDLECKNNCPK